jgi:hypothetical protein
MLFKYVPLVALLTGATLALPIKIREAEPKCESLPFWKEMVDLGLDFGILPPVSSIVANADNTVIVNVIGTTMEWNTFAKWSAELYSKFRDNPAIVPQFGVPRIQANIFVHTLTYSEKDAALAPGVNWNFFGSHWVNTYGNATMYRTQLAAPMGFDFIDAQGMIPDIHDILSSKRTWYHPRIGPLTGNSTAIQNLAGHVPKLPLEFYSALYACSRTYAGWNTRSASEINTKFAYKLASDVASRLENTDPRLRTPQMDSLTIMFRVLSQQLSASINKAPIVVPRWSTEVLQNQLKDTFAPALRLADRFKADLAPNVADQVRINSLVDMASVIKVNAESHRFVLDQQMQSCGDYADSVSSLSRQMDNLAMDLDFANRKFKTGVSSFKDESIAKGVFSFIKDTGNICAGLYSGDIGKVVSGTADLFNDAVAFDKLLNDLKEIEALQASIAGMFSDATASHLPGSSAELKDFLNKMEAQDVFTEAQRAALLKMSQFNRAAAANIVVKYDQIRSTIDNLFVYPIEKEIEGAAELVISIKKVSLLGKALVDAKISLVDAKATFARALYQAMMDKKQAKQLAEKAASTEAAMVAERIQYVKAIMPSIVSTQVRLLDNLASVCNAFYYTEAKDCDVISDAQLEAFSVRGLSELVDTMTGLIKTLTDAKPIQRQAWTLEPSPINISSHEFPDLIKDFKQTKSVTLPAQMFQELDELETLSAVCMLGLSVEVVGAKTATSTSQVRVDIVTMGSPALQRQVGSSQWLQFQTMALNVPSSYVPSTKKGMPKWTIEGALFDTASNFCRTPFQDVVLTVGAKVDLSEVTGIMLYMKGHATTTRKMTIPSQDQIIPSLHF